MRYVQQALRLIVLLVFMRVSVRMRCVRPSVNDALFGLSELMYVLIICTVEAVMNVASREVLNLLLPTLYCLTNPICTSVTLHMSN
jgi:hypothetical protein